MKKLLAFILLGACLTSFAEGQGGGNGGDAIICSTGVTLLDYFESTTRELKIELKGSTLREKTENWVKRFEIFDNYKAQVVKSYIDEMVTDLEKKAEDPNYRMKVFNLADKVTLVDVDDSFETAIPTGCSKEQLVIQKKPVMPEDRWYTVDKEIWDQMDMDQQAMTISHEAIYRLTIEKGATDSRFARYLNGLFASIDSESLSFANYVERAANAGKLTKGLEWDLDRILNKIVFTVDSIMALRGMRSDEHQFEMYGGKYHEKNLNVDFEYGKLTVSNEGDSLSLHLRSNSITSIKKIGLEMVYSEYWIGGTDKCDLDWDFKSNNKDLICTATRIFYENKLYRGKKRWSEIHFISQFDANWNLVNAEITK